jgi:hypothetical protein
MLPTFMFGPGRKRVSASLLVDRSRSQRMIGDHMTAAVSTFSVSTEFNDFLYAPVGAEENKMTLSVLSALSRLNVDPWVEAAQLSVLPKDTAARRLATLIARLPGGRWAQADCTVIANRLIELLPHGSRSKVTLAPQGVGLITHSTGLKILMCAALGLIAFLVATSNEPSRDDNPDRPAFNTRVPSQAQ